MISSLLTKAYSIIVISIFALYSNVVSTFTNDETKNNAQVVTHSIQKKDVSQIEEITKKEKITDDINNTKNTFTQVFTLATSTHIVPKTEQETIEEDYDHAIYSRRSNPCNTPIYYTLGSFDTRFNISKDYFLKKIEESTSLWNNAVGKKLFIYDPQQLSSSLSIHLIYDERQQRTDNNVLNGVEINNTKEAAEVLKRDYEAMEKEFTEHKNTYLQKVESYNTHQKAYNDSVASWNEKGGAPKNIFDELNKEKESLQKDADELTILRDTLTQELSIINKKIDAYNKYVAYANEKVATSNAVSRKKFTEGLYSGQENKIYIYQFSNEIKLNRVLTHELGHALGIGHTTSDTSIMYAINKGTDTSLEKEDIEELIKICSKK